MSKGSFDSPNRSSSPPVGKVLVTILDEFAALSKAGETALLSEPALSDWTRPEEDEAWASLQQAPESSSISRSRTCPK